jgi:hypothetical protein
MVDLLIGVECFASGDAGWSPTRSGWRRDSTPECTLPHVFSRNSCIRTRKRAGSLTKDLPWTFSLA